MIKHNFKIGDKVKYIGNIYEGAVGKIGIITEINGDCISVRYNTGMCVVCGSFNCGDGYTDMLWSKPRDIECAIRVGEQLLFSFMGDN